MTVPTLTATALLLLLSLSFPTLAAGEDHAHAATAGDIKVVHPWARAAHAGETSIVFFEVENAGAADRLLGAETSAAEMVQIVGIGLTDGDVSYQAIEAIDIPAGDFDFDPKGLGLLLTGLRQDLVQGEDFELELQFETAGHLHVHVEIEAQDASQHSHAGHSH